MTDKFVSTKNLKFLLYEVFDAESLTMHPYYEEYNRKMFDMVMDAAMELAEKLLWPVFQEMDKNPPEFIEDRVKVHPSIKSIMKEFGKGGWIAATVPEERGGEQLPCLIADCSRFIFMAANYSSFVYAGLSSGATNLIETFGSEDLFTTYVPKMYTGEWQGTMALTEPEAGSSLSDITTIAESTDEGYYKIQGQKIFISAGDYDGTENVVHLMLAKTKGGPPGAKGISLFVVPKKRFEKNGQLVPNDVQTSGIFHKLGYKGCPIVQLSLGDNNDCRGYLVGKAHRGLKYMFQMMNEARMAVGLGATAMATAAYYSALDYSKKRRQGRKISDKDINKLQVPIIEHADVKRMLMFQRAITEGSLSLLMQCSKYMDLEKISNNSEKEKYNLLLELLTPIAKTYPSEMGILSISQGLQCLGGSGYCDDYPLEQYYRDARIHPLHEGTTGIQGMDLLGRKVVMKSGKAFSLYMQEVNDTIQTAMKEPKIEPYAKRLQAALVKLKDVTRHLMQFAITGDVELFLADSTLYLEFFGNVTIAWQWLLQALAAQKAMAKELPEKEMEFYKGKLYIFKYFFHYELPRIESLAERLMEADGLTVEMKVSFFED